MGNFKLRFDVVNVLDQVYQLQTGTAWAWAPRSTAHAAASSGGFRTSSGRIRT
jgi:hypothetical protein